MWCVLTRACASDDTSMASVVGDGEVGGAGQWHGDDARRAKRKRLAAAATVDDGDEHVDGDEAKKAKSKVQKK